MLAGGDRATLAARAGVPAHRINGMVTALRRLLQVEGYPVITMDPGGRAVHLNRALLIEQFELAPTVEISLVADVASSTRCVAASSRATGSTHSRPA